VHFFPWAACIVFISLHVILKHVAFQLYVPRDTGTYLGPNGILTENVRVFPHAIQTDAHFYLKLGQGRVLPYTCALELTVH
jgi:hypothetical protein